MRVAVDVTPLVGRPTGVGTFVAGLIKSLATVEVVKYALNTPERYRNRVGTRRNRTGTAPAGIAGAAPTGTAPAPKMLWLPPSVAPWVWRFARIPIERKLGPLDVVHGTSFMVPPTRAALRVVTVHDLTYLMVDEVPRRVRWWDHYVRDAINTGAVVHTQSQYVADEVVRHYGAARVGVVRPSVKIHSAQFVAAAKQSHTPELPYILALGFSQPRKRLPLLVRAFAQVHQRLRVQQIDCGLMLVGPPGLDESALQAEIGRLPKSIRNRVVRRDWVPAPERDLLLGSAAVLAFPSIYEGFGYPALEAMALEVPVVAAQAGALPEAVGDAALLVAPDDEDALADGLTQVLTDADLATELVRRGTEHVAAHTIDHAAREMLALYAKHMG